MTQTVLVERIARQSRRPASRPGNDMISLASGDPDFETPAYIRDAHAAAIDAGYTHYANNQGDPELREALATQLANVSGEPWTASEIQITHGGSGALAAAILATINPGDKVLLPDPTYSLYADLIVMIGGEPVTLPQTPDFHLDLDHLRIMARSAKMIILCHPCNPTGVVYRRDELEALAEIAEEHDLWVLSDEAYDHIVYSDTEFVSTLAIPGLRKRLLYCQTFSKTYAMTGWRIGYLAGPQERIKSAGLVHRTFNGAMNSAVQRAALTAVITPHEAPEMMRREYEFRRNRCMELLETIPELDVQRPDGAFYLFARSRSGYSSDAMRQRAQEHGLAIRGGNEYGIGGEGFIRLAFSSSREDIEKGFARLKHVFEDLGNSADATTG